MALVLVAVGCGPTPEELRREDSVKAEAVWKPFSHRVQAHLAAWHPRGVTGSVAGNVREAELYGDRITQSSDGEYTGVLRIRLRGEDVTDPRVSHAQTWELYYGLRTGTPIFSRVRVLRSQTRVDDNGNQLEYLKPVPDLESDKFAVAAELWRLGVMPHD